MRRPEGGAPNAYGATRRQEEDHIRNGRADQTPACVPAVVANIGATADGIVAWSDTTAVIAAPAA